MNKWLEWAAESDGALLAPAPLIVIDKHHKFKMKIWNAFTVSCREIASKDPKATVSCSHSGSSIQGDRTIESQNFAWPRKWKLTFQSVFFFFFFAKNNMTENVWKKIKKFKSQLNGCMQGIKVSLLLLQQESLPLSFSWPSL